MAGVTIGEYTQPDGKADGNLECCTNPDDRVTVRYASATMQQIRNETVAGFLSLRRGGLEVGGVLFGTIDGTTVTVLEHRPLTIEYGGGPSFVLSDNDEANLQRLIAEPDSGAELQGLQAVGWYHSHTRSEVFLSPEDIAVHDRYFPLPEQIALVIKPSQFEPAQVGVYVREADGTLRGDAPLALIELAPISQKASTETAVAPIVESFAGEPAAPRPFLERLSPEPLTVPPPRRSLFVHRKAVAIGSAFVAIAAAGLVFFVRASDGHSAAPMQLHVSGGPADQLTISWNGDSPAARQARAASITIVDGSGENPAISLDEESLKQGTITYVRRSGEVVVRMRVAPQKGPVLEEVARFIGPPPVKAPVVTQTSDAELQRTKAELERIKGELSRVQPENQRSRVVTPEPTAKVVASAPPPRRLLSLVLPRPAVGEMKLPESAPQLQLSRSMLPSGAPPIAALSAPIAPPTQQASRPATRPAAGRMIWTGRLQRGGMLLIDGRRPSIGTLNGSLPDKPVRMRVHSAELAQSGIVVYTPTARSQAIEPPSAANGWNLTTYSTDPKRSRAVSVVESPGQHNDWKPRLLIRSEDKNVSMLVIDWEEVSLPAKAQ